MRCHPRCGASGCPARQIGLCARHKKLGEVYISCSTSGQQGQHHFHPSPTPQHRHSTQRATWQAPPSSDFAAALEPHRLQESPIPNVESITNGLYKIVHAKAPVEESLTVNDGRVWVEPQHGPYHPSQTVSCMLAGRQLQINGLLVGARAPAEPGEHARLPAREHRRLFERPARRHFLRRPAICELVRAKRGRDPPAR
jgi:hypothetical protein